MGLQKGFHICYTLCSHLIFFFVINYNFIYLLNGLEVLTYLFNTIYYYLYVNMRDIVSYICLGELSR